MQIHFDKKFEQKAKLYIIPVLCKYWEVYRIILENRKCSQVFSGFWDFVF